MLTDDTLLECNTWSKYESFFNEPNKYGSSKKHSAAVLHYSTLFVRIDWGDDRRFRLSIFDAVEIAFGFARMIVSDP